VFSKAQSSPGEPQYFSVVGGARSGCYEAPTPIREALWLHRVCVGTYLSSFDPLSSPGKNSAPTRACLSITTIGIEARNPVCASPDPHPDSGIESLKVIAFDNSYVNPHFPWHNPTNTGPSHEQI
jgi:hypothetical protein